MFVLCLRSVCFVRVSVCGFHSLAHRDSLVAAPLKKLFLNGQKHSWKRTKQRRKNQSIPIQPNEKRIEAEVNDNREKMHARALVPHVVVIWRHFICFPFSL
jgi:hypothetical protein